jgi:hemerythrin
VSQESQAITWRAEFATGVAIIDDQHRVLIHMLNDASTKLNDRSPIADFSKIVQGLLSYAGYHFQTEDRLMAEYDYAGQCAAAASMHASQHKAFAEKVIAVQETLKAGQRVQKAVLVSFLTEWLADHILNTDKALGAYIGSQQAGGVSPGSTSSS